MGSRLWRFQAGGTSAPGEFSTKSPFHKIDDLLFGLVPDPFARRLDLGPEGIVDANGLVALGRKLATLGFSRHHQHLVNLRAQNTIYDNKKKLSNATFFEICYRVFKRQFFMLTSLKNRYSIALQTKRPASVRKHLGGPFTDELKGVRPCQSYVPTMALAVKNSSIPTPKTLWTASALPMTSAPNGAGSTIPCSKSPNRSTIASPMCAVSRTPGAKCAAVVGEGW